MSRLTKRAIRSGSSGAALSASFPMVVMPSSNRTTLGVVRSPSALTIVCGRPPCSTKAIAEKVVPRSIPIGGWAGMAFVSLGDNSGCEMKTTALVTSLCCTPFNAELVHR